MRAHSLNTYIPFSSAVWDKSVTDDISNMVNVFSLLYAIYFRGYSAFKNKFSRFVKTPSVLSFFLLPHSKLQKFSVNTAKQRFAVHMQCAGHGHWKLYMHDHTVKHFG
jgi:hypothetical protein